MTPNEYRLKFFAELERLVDGHGAPRGLDLPNRRTRGPVRRRRLVPRRAD